MVTIKQIAEASKKTGVPQGKCIPYLRKTNGNVEAAIALMKTDGLC